MSANQPPASDGWKQMRVISVSIPPGKRAAFFDALAILQRHHEDPFIQAAPLIVETIIEAARRVQQEAEQTEGARAHDGRELSHPSSGHMQSRESL